MFIPWQNMTCSLILIVPDDVVELNETFSVTLDSNDDAVLLGLSSANVTITDDDGRLNVETHKDSGTDLLYFYSVGVIIGLEMVLYSAQEEDGQITVCAELINGALERVVLVNVTTADSSAQGMKQEL